MCGVIKDDEVVCEWSVTGKTRARANREKMRSASEGRVVIVRLVAFNANTISVSSDHSD